jgi:thiamine-phosphate pyrophosphorylase
VTILPRLYVICDADVCERAGWSVTDYAAACLDGGATLLQLRAKRAASGWLLRQARAIVRRAESCQATVIVNDRADVARLAGAAGVHVGQDDLSPAAARTVVGAAAVVGLSTHTPAQIERALAEPISYLAIGPAFGTATKNTGYDAVGLAAIAHAARRAATRQLPLVAIGGITLERAAAVIEAGADSLAIITDLLATGDPRARAAEFVRVLSRV